MSSAAVTVSLEDLKNGTYDLIFLHPVPNPTPADLEAKALSLSQH
jgi:hypothetical protein